MPMLSFNFTNRMHLLCSTGIRIQTDQEDSKKRKEQRQQNSRISKLLYIQRNNSYTVMME